MHALATTVYIALVAWFMTNAEQWVGETRGFAGPLAMLLVFVVSAAVTGALVLGRPLMWYLEGEKTAAVKLFLYTVAWLFIAAVSVFGTLASR